MRRIQADEDEDWRKTKAKHDEARRRVQQEGADTKRELETKKDAYQREKARSNAEKVKNLTRPKANLRTIETADELLALYHSLKIDNDEDPDLPSKIKNTFALLQMLQSGIANKSVDELRNLIWHDDYLDV